MKILNFASLGLSIFFLGLASTSVQGFTLDLFKDVSSDPGFNAPLQKVESTWDDTGSSQSDSSSIGDLSGVQWGQRKLSLTIESNDPFISLISGDKGELRVVTNGRNVGFVDLATSSTIIASGSIEWDGWNGTTADLVNLEAEDKNAFNLEVISLDQGIELKFKVTDKDDNIATISEAITNSIANESVIFEYQNAPEYNTVDFTQVKHIELAISNPNDVAAVDFKFNLVETTQVPFEFSPTLGIILSSTFLGFKIWNNKQKIASTSKLSD